MTGDLWYPEAKHKPLPDAGAFTGGGHKVVLHTTEGSTIAGCYEAVKAANVAPHFALNPRTGALHQYIPLNRAGRALAHPSGPETNRANAIQIELVGFASQTQDWPDGYLNRIGKLCLWIERHFDVPRRTGVEFVGGGATPHMTGQGFVDYAGYCGHQHVPGNDHWDPGKFRINYLLTKGFPA